eukprot:TRINITY_DN600_c0_g2_i5.p1 TRINITY_DN600_c0_g2~~TRINITY_DN600_c0_g2_i5.p1  ORF type:complete len:241 (+),score=32.70 TRINITY_DN600_c0_g2_i5:262-984(+)
MKKGRMQIPFLAYPVITDIDEERAGVLRRLWADPGIQNTHKLRNRIITRGDSEKQLIFQFPYDAEYFFSRLDIISDPDYIPEFEDMVHSRNRTTGILESSLLVHKDPFHVVDVGGQRSERKKWIHCFEGVTGVIFVIALSDYDLKLFEDERVNRMDEALSLFEEICNSRWFQKTSTILFLNKSDLFKRKSRFQNSKIVQVLQVGLVQTHQARRCMRRRVLISRICLMTKIEWMIGRRTHM